MMKKQIVVMFVVWLFTACNLLDVNARQVRDYVVLTSKEMQSDKAWMKVVEVLSKRHKATVLYYDKQLRELLAELRRLTPRYVAVVEKPENLNREFVMEGHRLSREIDDDIYADYLWGIITGYSAADAMRMVESGNGITFIPELATLQLSKEQKELVRPFAIPKPTREIVFVTRKDFIRHTVAGILIESIKKAVPKEMLTLQPGQKVV